MNQEITRVFAPGAPSLNAEQFVVERFAHPERITLIAQGGAFFGWDGAAWPQLEDADLRAAFYKYFRHADYVNDRGNVVNFDPTAHKVNDLVDALKAFAHLSTTVTTPAWLNGVGLVPATEIVAATNGLVHVPTRTLLTPTPLFYAHYAVPFAFEPDAPPPERWLRFLDEVWPGDVEAQCVLQEIFGYALGGGTSLQKLFLIVGPKRSGKGTIARVLTALIGAHSVAGPTLASLGTNFGLWPLIAKPLAIVADARIRDNETIVTERLLSISGEDFLTIDRKYLPLWTGRLPTRFLVLSNELPRLSDSSGAMASRIVLLIMEQSFYGHENPRLTDELLEELPAIFNWALDGLERLHARGYFVQAASSADALMELEDLGSPMSAFVRERCEVGAGLTMAIADLYQAWRDWCTDHGRDHPGTAAAFGRDLRAAVPGLKVVQPRDEGVRQRRYEGIALAANTYEWNAFQRVPAREEWSVPL